MSWVLGGDLPMKLLTLKVFQSFVLHDVFGYLGGVSLMHKLQ